MDLGTGDDATTMTRGGGGGSRGGRGGGRGGGGGGSGGGGRGGGGGGGGAHIDADDDLNINAASSHTQDKLRKMLTVMRGDTWRPCLVSRV